MSSVSFDRAAEYYDRTRVLSAEAQERLVAVLGPEIRRAGGLCLEVGVGTGRVAAPLLREGVQLLGMDLSVEMMLRLRAKHARVPLAVADATRLPVRDDSVGSVVCAHVLHLIPDWRSALREVVRVLRPGGVALISLGVDRNVRDEHDEIGEEFVRAAGHERKRFVGLDHDPGELDSAMAGLGFTGRVLEPIVSERATSPREIIDSLEQGLFSFTWSIADGVRTRAAAETREWAVRRFGDLDATIPLRLAFMWRAYETPVLPQPAA